MTSTVSGFESFRPVDQRHRSKSLSLQTRARHNICALLFLLLMTTPTLAAEYSICGKGPRINCIVDGDTIWHDGQKIRLMGFDTPEKGGRARCERERVLADKATTRLQALLNRGYVTFEFKGKDRYGRALAVTRVSGNNVGQTLIREGLAKAYGGGKRDRSHWCR